MLPLDPVILLTFVPAALALNLTPGADMMFCAGQGLRAGTGAGWRASGGVALGGMIHATVAGLGVGGLVAAHPEALLAIRWLGAAYLLYMAWGILRAETAGPDMRPARPFRDGLLVNLTNPKVILFILAFVPQFVTPDRAVLPQFLVMGAVLSLGGFVVNGVAGMLAGLVQARLAGAGGAWARRIAATIFAALALRLVLGTKG